MVVGVGHGRESVARVMAEQAGRVGLRPRHRVHERRAGALRGRARAAPADGRPGDLPRLRRLRGDGVGAQARPGLPPRPRRDRALDRDRPVGQLPRQHPRRAGPVRPQAAPAPVRVVARAVPARLGGLPYRAGEPGANALGDAAELAAELERAIEAAEPGTVAAFVAEPIVGATLAAAVPPEGYWPAIAEVCRRHGVLLVADEVMTGFGRTGRWFGAGPLGRPAGHPRRRRRARTSGYFPFGFVAASGDVRGPSSRAAGFVHGFTYSHHAVGAAVAGEVLRILEDERARRGERRQGRAAADAPPRAPRRPPNVGEIRGRGLLVGVELVADRETRAPFPRGERPDRADRARRRARAACSLYPARGSPTARTATRSCSARRSSITDDELERIADGLTAAIEIDATTAAVA